MLQNIIQRYRERRENGSADMIAALAITPIVIFLLIGTLNAGIWMNTKSHVEASTRDAARLAAMWGGTNDTRLNNTGMKIQDIMMERLWTPEKGCIPSHCYQKPNVWCEVSGSSAGRWIASAAGQKIHCRVRYFYKSIPGAQLFSFVPTGEIVSEAHSYSETGFR